MKRMVVWGVVLLLALAVVAGTALGGRSRALDPYDAQRAALGVEMARTMLPFHVAFRIMLGGVVLFTLGGVGWGIVRWLNRRADTVYPDRAGLYPIREGRVGRAKVFHDPNRVPTGTTVYAPRQTAISVQHPLPEGRLDVQQQVTGQAQAAQALRAAVSGPSALPAGQALPLDLLDERRVSRPLPEVRELRYEPSHIERLLLQEGQGSG